MDVPRTDQAGAKRKKRVMYIVCVVVVVAGLAVALRRLKPAAPTVERNLVWIDTVKRGQMLRQVRGFGTLVPEEIRWIAARTQGRVDNLVVRPGASVTPDSVVLQLANPDVVHAAAAADSQLKAAETEYLALQVTLQSSVLQAESIVASAKSDYEHAKLRAEVNEQLFQEGLVSDLERRLSRVTAEQAATRYGIEQKRFAFAKDSIQPQLAVKEAEVDRLRAQARLRHEERDALTVRAGMNGVLQLLPVEVGAQVQPGTNLARVAGPTRLKAEIRIPETQARDVQIGQLATIDTHNGVVEGKVGRIDPSVQDGTVMIDVLLTGELPKGARPDLSVDGTIELERLDDIVFVGRPAFGQERSRVGIFRIEPDGVHATRTSVQLGRSSVKTIEVVDGLELGDKVILSDMSQWDANDRLQLR